ncbi:MAG: hypothetical protein HOC71_13270 [Candidatus Latescibacteria bacterium]|nr:hypothetical protein [Candidatus Latescibacterota bacterium]
MDNLSIGILEKRRDAKIKQLRELGPVLQGSITTLKTTCGKSNCKCARGEKHTSTVLSKKVNGKTKSLYIPTDMVVDAKKWVQENKKLRKLQKEISDYSEQILRQYVKSKRAKQENLKLQSLVVSKKQKL